MFPRESPTSRVGSLTAVRCGTSAWRNPRGRLLSEGKTAEAADELRPLHDDLCLVDGAQHEETLEVADVLARIRFASDG